MYTCFRSTLTSILQWAIILLESNPNILYHYSCCVLNIFPCTHPWFFLGQDVYVRNMIWKRVCIIKCHNVYCILPLIPVISGAMSVWIFLFSTWLWKNNTETLQKINAQYKPKRDGEKQSHYQLSLYIMDKHICHLVVGYTSWYTTDTCPHANWI